MGVVLNDGDRLPFVEIGDQRVGIFQRCLLRSGVIFPHSLLDRIDRPPIGNTPGVTPIGSSGNTISQRRSRSSSAIRPIAGSFRVQA